MKEVNYLLTGAGLHLLAVHLTATMGNWDIPTSNIIQIRGSSTNADRFVLELNRLYNTLKDSKAKVNIHVVGLKHNPAVIAVMKKMLERGMRIKIFHINDAYLKNNINNIIPYFKSGSNIFMADHDDGHTLGTWFLSFTTGITKPQIKAITEVDEAVMCTISDKPLTEIIRGMIVILSKVGTMAMLKNVILSNTNRGGSCSSFNLADALTAKDTMITLSCALNALQKTRHIQYVLQDKLHHNVSVQDIDKFINKVKELFVSDVYVKHMNNNEIRPLEGGLKTTTPIYKLNDTSEVHGVYCVTDIDGYVKYLLTTPCDESANYKLVFALIPEDDYISVQVRSLHPDLSAISGMSGLNEAFKDKLGCELISLIGGTNKSGGGQIKYETYAKILYLI